MIKKILKNIRNRLNKAISTNRQSKKSLDRVLANINDKAVLPEKKTVRRPAERGKTQPEKEPSKRKKQRETWDISQFSVPETQGGTRFHDLNLPAKIMHAIADLGYQYCTPIQAEILPKVLEGSDATGKAQTGTGKSAAFLINVYTQLLRKPLQGKRRPGIPRVLILAPTRELALQIEKDSRDVGKYTNISILSVFGGLGYNKQKKILAEKRVDIIVATPGRLLDFISQKLVKLYKLEILIIDEADRMLDMGFIPDVRKIVYSTPPKHKRQTMFFSATLTPEVERLAEQWTRDPIHVDIEPEKVAAESINQKIYIVTTEEKLALLINLILSQDLERVLVFVNRRDQATSLEQQLRMYGINSAVLTGAIPQKKRIKTLDGFGKGAIRVLVATDVAARGLHIEGISHVVNYHLPHDPEDYVHRIGRTGRAGASGISVGFACEEDSFYIPPIEEYIGNPLKCIQPDDDLLRLPEIKKEQARDNASRGYKKSYPRRRPRRRPRKRTKSGDIHQGSDIKNP